MSANARWDNTVAILTGDFLFSRASNLLADLGPRRSGSRPARSSGSSRPDPRDGRAREPGDDPIEHYLRVLADKTGSLIATSAAFGALLAGVGRGRRRPTLRDFGEQIGVAFQLSDDILDIASESDRVRARRRAPTCARASPTLPVLYALRSDDRAPPACVSWSAPPHRRRRARRGAALLRGSTALDDARDTLPSYADTARNMLADLPDVPARAAFEALTDIVLERTG